MPTEAAHALRPHAETTLAAADTARDAVAAVSSMEQGTVRFGMFGAARLYPGAALIADVLERHPGLRVELVGTNSTVVIDELRQGRLQAAIVTIPVVDETLTVRPIARDELVYVSADPERVRLPATPKRVSDAPLVLSDACYREVDSVRRNLAGLAAARRPHRDLAGRGRGRRDRARAGAPRAGRHRDPAGRAARADAPRWRASCTGSACGPGSTRRSPSCTVHDSVLSPATRLLIELATTRIREVAEPVH